MFRNLCLKNKFFFPPTGYAGEGQNYSSDYNMNSTFMGPPVDRALTRRALAAAFNPKGILAQASSPEACFEYEFIRRDFKVKFRCELSYACCSVK